MAKKGKEFEEDPRYKQCNKEAIMGLVLGIVNLIWWFGFGYGLGSKPLSEYIYVWFSIMVFYELYSRRSTIFCINRYNDK